MCHNLTNQFFKNHERVAADFQILPKVDCKGDAPGLMVVNADLLRPKYRAAPTRATDSPTCDAPSRPVTPGQLRGLVGKAKQQTQVIKKARRKTSADRVDSEAEAATTGPPGSGGSRKSTQPPREPDGSSEAEDKGSLPAEETSEHHQATECQQLETTTEENRNLKTSRQPVWRLVHQGVVKLSDLAGENPQLPGQKTVPDNLRLEIELPKVVTAASISTDIGAKSFYLTTQPHEYEAKISLPYPVLKEQSAGKFDRKKRILTVILPVDQAASAAASHVLKDLTKEVWDEVAPPQTPDNYLGKEAEKECDSRCTESPSPLSFFDTRDSPKITGGEEAVQFDTPGQNDAADSHDEVNLRVRLPNEGETATCNNFDTVRESDRPTGKCQSLVSTVETLETIDNSGSGSCLNDELVQKVERMPVDGLSAAVDCESSFADTHATRVAGAPQFSSLDQDQQTVGLNFTLPEGAQLVENYVNVEIDTSQRVRLEFALIAHSPRDDCLSTSTDDGATGDAGYTVFRWNQHLDGGELDPLQWSWEVTGKTPGCNELRVTLQKAAGSQQLWSNIEFLQAGSTAMDQEHFNVAAARQSAIDEGYNFDDTVVAGRDIVPDTGDLAGNRSTVPVISPLIEEHISLQPVPIATKLRGTEECTQEPVALESQPINPPIAFWRLVPLGSLRLLGVV
eukprot:GHVT01067708.1.p1 GENE.GHVT01067708.1~~GHVT01067708.1.p1  ORF type:complete len:681 (+),score=104.78 GHVT01067708.1:326-2368(+)